MKCNNIYCERNDNIQISGCRIKECNTDKCIVNKRFKERERFPTNKTK